MMMHWEIGKLQVPRRIPVFRRVQTERFGQLFEFEQVADFAVVACAALASKRIETCLRVYWATRNMSQR
jgi:hypothetical protein